jgi:O-acetyl-ADP-ribose deacetylase (regulator of RNase III)
LAEVAGEYANIPAGEIVVTGAGELERTHGVKRIFHAAAVTGQVGKGYAPIADIGICVRNALQMADTEELQNIELKSILFPLMGAGTARGDLESKAKELIDAAISHLEAHPQCRIDRVYFLTLSEEDLEVCQRILQETQDVVSG